MDKNAYAMAKFGLESRDSLISKKGCGFYMKYVFLFTSVIQFLIILGLVLFMIYGNTHASTDTHMQHLEEKIQELYRKITELNAKNLNVTRQLNTTTKEKLACLQQVEKTQKDLEKCNATLKNYIATQVNYQGILSQAQYYQMVAETCYGQMIFLNMSCYGERLLLQKEKDNLAAEVQHQKANCSKEMEKLQKKDNDSKGKVELCEKQVIDLRAERSQMAQAQDKCCSLGEKVMGKVHAAQTTILTSLSSLLPFQLSSCPSLSEAVTTQLKTMAEKLQQDVQAQAQQNGRLQVENVHCSENLKECKRQSTAEAQQFQQMLQGKQATCDAEAKRNYEEKQALKGEVESVKRLVQEKNVLLQQAAGVKAQLEACRKGKAFPGTFGNPGILTNPGIFGNTGTQGNPGTFGNPGTLGNPGTFGNPGTLGNPGTFGNPGLLGNPGTFGNQGTLGNPGTFGNPGMLGNPRAFGNPGMLGNPRAFGNPGMLGNPGTLRSIDKTGLDESIQRRILQESKLPNQFPLQPVAQPSG